MDSGDKQVQPHSLRFTEPQAGDFRYLPTKERGIAPGSAPSPDPAPPASPPPRPALPRDVPQRAGLMRTRVPRPARLHCLGGCHSPRRGGECRVRRVPAFPLACRRACDVIDRLGAGWQLSPLQRLGFSLAAFLVEPRFPRSRRHAPEARSAALRGGRQLQRSGPRGRVQPLSSPPPPRLSPRSQGGWCRAAAPRPAPAAARAVRGRGALCAAAVRSPPKAPCRLRPSKLTVVFEVGGRHGKGRFVFVIFTSWEAGDGTSC